MMGVGVIIVDILILLAHGIIVDILSTVREVLRGIPPTSLVFNRLFMYI